MQSDNVIGRLFSSVIVKTHDYKVRPSMASHRDGEDAVVAGVEDELREVEEREGQEEQQNQWLILRKDWRIFAEKEFLQHMFINYSRFVLPHPLMLN